MTTIEEAPPAPLYCLCGRRHPCPAHGAWAAKPDQPDQLDLFDPDEEWR